MEYACVKDLAAHWQQQRQVEVPALPADVCPEGMTGDITVNCFRLAKPLRANPAALATEAAAFLVTHPDVAAAAAVKGFVNVTLRPAALYRDTVADEAALLAAPLLPPVGLMLAT